MTASTARIAERLKEDQIYIPPQVNLKHLKPNGRLITDDDYARISKYLQNKPHGHYSKHELKIPYGVEKKPDGLYLVYNDDGNQVEIGEGSWGKVKLVQRFETAKWYAHKTISTKNDWTYIELNNAQELGMTPHKTLSSRPSKKSLDDMKLNMIKRSLILELARGQDLHTFLVEDKTRINNIPDIFRLHLVNLFLKHYKESIADKKFIHCDIKLENILFDWLSGIKLIDVAFSQKYDNESKSVIGFKSCGTPAYIAPEIHHKLLFSEKSDIYAMGVMFTEILFARLRTEVYEGSGVYEWDRIPGISDTAWLNNAALNGILFKMIHPKAAQRPPLEEVCKFFENLQIRYEMENPEEIKKLKVLEESAKALEMKRMPTDFKFSPDIKLPAVDETIEKTTEAIETLSRYLYQLQKHFHEMEKKHPYTSGAERREVYDAFQFKYKTFYKLFESFLDKKIEKFTSAEINMLKHDPNFEEWKQFIPDANKLIDIQIQKTQKPKILSVPTCDEITKPSPKSTQRLFPTTPIPVISLVPQDEQPCWGCVLQ